MNEKVSKAFGVLFVRVLLGIIFIMQGYGKVFTYTLPKVYDLFFKSFEKMGLPQWLLVSTLYYTSYVELLCGFLLIIGLCRRYAIVFLCIDLLIVSFGHGLAEPIWDLQHVIPRAALLIILLFIPQQWDLWHTDKILLKKTP